MQIKKTMRCKIYNLTNIKEKILNDEYDDYQILCKQIQDCINNDMEPKWAWFKTDHRHCSYLSGAKRMITEQFHELGEQPLYLRNDVFCINKNNNKMSKYWFNLPTKKKRGGIWLPLNVPKKYQEFLGLKMCDSKIVRRNDNWFLLLTVQKEITIKKSYSSIIGIDLGIRHIASVVHLSDGRPRFYGQRLREIKGHYFYLRRQLGRKKTKKRFENKENRLIDDQLHKISHDIVEWAKQTNSAIVSGKLTGLKNKDMGRKFNRKLNSFPWFKLNELIRHKANWEGISFITVTEENTSKTCHKCGEILKRKGKHKGLVVCKCGYEDNADRNGAINISRRGLGYMLSSGASFTDHALNDSEEMVQI
jgi:putative transposase